MRFIHKIFLVNFLFLILFIIDRATKWFALYKLPHEGASFMPKFLDFKLSLNYGLAFSLNFPESLILFFSFLVILILFGLLYKNYLEKNLFLIISLTLILIGAISNIIDRIKYGYVIDFIDVYFFTVFNLADILIVAGVILLSLVSFKNKSSQIRIVVSTHK